MGTDSKASTAGALTAPIEIGVGKVKRMAVDAVGFPSIYCGRRLGAGGQRILAIGSESRVPRVNAVTDATEVVKLEANRNWANELLVGESMRCKHPTVAVELAIPLAVANRQPEPTGIGKENLRPKASFNWRMAGLRA